MVLWREQANNIGFTEGNVIILENVVVSKFNSQCSLTTTFETLITVVEESMTIASTQHPRPKSDVVSLNTSILAIKEFSCMHTCIDCRSEITSDHHMRALAITCPTCSTTFLKQEAQLSNHCMILLSDKKWVKAHTRVSIIKHY